MWSPNGNHHHPPTGTRQPFALTDGQSVMAAPCGRQRIQTTTRCRGTGSGVCERPIKHLDLDTLQGYGFFMTFHPADRDELLKRLRRIEGQVRGIAQMIEDDRYCVDVLTQVSAVTRALQSVAVGLLDDHLRHCVVDAVAAGGFDADRKLTEATAAIERLLKS